MFAVQTLTFWLLPENYSVNYCLEIFVTHDISSNQVYIVLTLLGLLCKMRENGKVILLEAPNYAIVEVVKNIFAE